MTATRALIDAEFHDTPIGRCVVLPAKFATTFDPLTEADVLAVVTSSSISDASPKWLRRGFVRVVEVLPVFAKSDKHDLSSDHVCIRHDCTFLYHHKPGRGPYGSDKVLDDHVLNLPVSPGDVVLVTEPWCETPPSPVRVIHRDGALGEVET